MATFNWPGFGIASVAWTLDQPSQSNASAWTGKRTVIANPWHGKWAAKVTLATQQGDAAFRAARAFFTGLNGTINTFHLPAVESPQNTNSGVTVATNAAQGASSLALTGLTDAIVAGNMITIAGQLLSITTVGSLSGAAQTVNFMPVLRAAATAGASVQTAKPYALVSLSDSAFSWDIGQWRRYGLSFEVQEAVAETDGADPALDVWTGGVSGGSGGGSISFTFPQLPSFASRALLAAVVGPTNGQVAYLTEAGREGIFIFRTGSHSGEVTNDTRQGIYVAPAADTSGASGAWVRDHGGTVTHMMFGTVDGTLPKATGEAVSDNSDALDGMWAIVRYLAVTKKIGLTIDFSGAVGLGISRPWVLDAVDSASFWDTPVIRIMPGRLVAMASMSEMVMLKGKSFNVIGEWQCYGGTFDQINAGYGGALAKYGVIVEDAGGSRIGDIRGEGLRRYALRFSNAGGTNNIPITVGDVKVARVGNFPSTLLAFSGTYASGSWQNNPTYSNDSRQTHRMTLTPMSGVDPADIEVGDLINFNGSTSSPGVVMAIHTPSDGTKVVVDVFPWQSIEASGTFRSMHGGGVDAMGSNLANTNINLIETLVAGTSIRLSALYCPKIGTLLSESTACAVQLGTNNLESMEGLDIEHLHVENVIYAVLDVGASCSAAWFGVPSNFEGTNRGKFDKCMRVNPARVSGGSYQAPVRTGMVGVGFRMNGGNVESARGLNIEKDISGAGAAVIGNSPEYQFGPCYANAFDFYLIAERSLTEQISSRNSKMVHWGPIYGTGTHGAPTGNVTFNIWSGDLLGGSTTIDGGATRTLTSSDGALQGVAVYEPPASGNNGNWKIFYWKATGA